MADNNFSEPVACQPMTCISKVESRKQGSILRGVAAPSFEPVGDRLNSRRPQVDRLSLRPASLAKNPQSLTGRIKVTNTQLADFVSKYYPTAGAPKHNDASQTNPLCNISLQFIFGSGPSPRRAVNSFSFFLLEIFYLPAPGRRSDHSGGNRLLPFHGKPSNGACATSECRNVGSDAGLPCLDLVCGVAECRATLTINIEAKCEKSETGHGAASCSYFGDSVGPHLIDHICAKCEKSEAGHGKRSRP